ncbi:PREDICTED: tetratricopeptide repeat protein 33 [Dipodomys ordii]|uniref:Tetratricopeptide repeat protein 33 n=1 Tax=Dipodomys ordii TaxID=10020 RepID=A0A1S3FCI2_DIPOR|nr:PREDICTED: tetratricopeptide repeat protein 33 [Dipodomys ordii]
MASFGWKRKIGEKVSKATSQQFEAEAADEKDGVENDDGNWLHATKRRREILQEDCAEKSKQLKEEGANLAESKRYREAIQKWDEALQLTPNDATLYEMKSQVIIKNFILYEIVLCLIEAQDSNIQTFVEALNTEAQQIIRNMAFEAILPVFASNLAPFQSRPSVTDLCASAIRSFQIALHIYPMNPEIWQEDLSWARTLQEQQKVAQRVKKSEAPSGATQFSPKSIPDYDFESDEIVAVCAAIAEKQKTVSANKTMVIVSASGTVETVTEKEEGATLPDNSVFIKAR